MLNKECIMCFVIGDKKMQIFLDLTSNANIGDMNQYCDLVGVPMHRLNFILLLKGVIFNKIYDKYNHMVQECLYTLLELFSLPLIDKVVSNQWRCKSILSPLFTYDSWGMM